MRHCQAYIKAGDIFQVVPSQRFAVETQADPFDIYRVLRVVNPSPFLFYLPYGDFALIGSSPEILVRVENGTVTIRPLAGTRRRGATRPRTVPWPKSSWRIPRSAPSTSCSSTWDATTWVGSLIMAQSSSAT